ncbi:MAG: bifunctional phosphopantothenoylcysteine decarboxylase/phosphopantothenate--cysteine ligase CoaBC [Pseudomonadota bacterium]
MTDTPEPPSADLSGKRILLGISGGIAAYKTPDLVRRLRAAGADVQVVMTRSAHQFVTATSLQAVAGAAVRTDLWDAAAEAAMGHIELARWADAVLIAPATANCIAKLAQGLADDLLSTLCLATTSPIYIAPAMNVRMWQHPRTQRNLATLAATAGTPIILGPASGAQACGETGPGRMLEPAEIVEQLGQGLEATAPLLAGRRVLITAGPTREPIDPVRFISNRSSGRQGYALAAAAARMGANVTLVSGPTALDCPQGVRRIDVLSATDMLAAVLAEVEQGTDLFIAVAAVADYRVATIAEQKIKKTDQASRNGMQLDLVENPDIVATVAGLEDGPVTVGFAAETHDGLAHARAKRARKGLDLIALNDVADASIGFRSEDNALTLIWADGEQTLPKAPKSAIASALLTEVHRLFLSAD